ncbi:AAA domain-containing protein [Aspergillus cavernicola]|uniref:AAA domain-containing protein n=1 Tax=Aspergillus cavernicola TaxID=176166 RepID=A0ABR4IM62_9EURO
MQASSLYIIGAQCTGKTTLVNALQDALSQRYPSLLFRPITEVAREVLRQHQFTRDDITDSPDRALELQRLILAAQFEEENKESTTPVLCDRSGVDPIVYAVKYGPRHAQQMLEDSPQWHFLRGRIRKSLVIICPPHRGWYKDDGTRLMAKSWAEWEDVHITFVQVLETNGIAYQVMPQELLDLQDRVDFVLHLWNSR